MSKYRYEGLLILNVKGKEDGAQKIIDRIEKDFKAEGCEVESVQKMDTRHFSYVAGDLDSGFYVNFVFKAAPAIGDFLVLGQRIGDEREQLDVRAEGAGQRFRALAALGLIRLGAARDVGQPGDFQRGAGDRQRNPCHHP